MLATVITVYILMIKVMMECIMAEKLTKKKSFPGLERQYRSTQTYLSTGRRDSGLVLQFNCQRERIKLNNIKVSMTRL